MVSGSNDGNSSESQIEVTLRSLEKLIDGTQLLFHARFKHTKHQITELYDAFNQKKGQDESFGIRYENISKSTQSSVEQYILSTRSELSKDIQTQISNAMFFSIKDERPLSILESETMSKQAANEKIGQKAMLGILIILPDHNSHNLNDIVKHKLTVLVPLLQQACYYDLDKAKMVMEDNFHKSLIQLNRIAQGEMIDKRTGFRSKAGPIFNLGAEILYQSFEPFAKVCAIFDASNIRYVHSSSTTTSNSGVESGKNSSGGGGEVSETFSVGTQMTSIKDEQPELARFEEKNGNVSNDEIQGSPVKEDNDRHPEPFGMLDRNNRKRESSFDATQSYVTSSKFMHGKDVGTFAGRRFQQGQGQASMSPPNSANLTTDLDGIQQEEMSDSQSTDLSAEEREDEGDEDDPIQEDHVGPDGLLDFMPAANGRVICSFPQSKQNVALLGLHGGDEEKYKSLCGNFLRRIMAGYFASARQKGLASQVYCEMGEGAEVKGKGKKSNFRKALGAIDKDNVVLTAACFDRLGQPAFMIVLLIQESSIVFDSFKRRVIELVGITLSNAALHIRAEELSQAQNIFTQKVQHELRTPLHGILGVNEAILDALHHAQNRADKSEQNEGRFEDVESLLKELVSLTHSINDSADDLSTLIDDLVDFSKPIVKAEDIQNLSKDLRKARDKREMPFQVLLSILSAVSERRWQAHLNKRINPMNTSPELFFWFNPTSKDIGSYLDINVDAVGRILGKLVANAMEATVEGMVRIEVTLQDASCNKVDETISLEKVSKSHITKSRRAKKTCILTIKVHDTGKGMSKAFLAHQIFEAYQKEDLNKPGIGLSLALCRTITEEMGGHIVADSEEGKGSTISVSFPAILIDKRSDDLQEDRRESYASISTVTPDLNIAFYGCKSSASFCALKDILLEKFGMLDATSKFNNGDLEKVDIIFIIPDGLNGQEEAVPRIQGTSKGEPNRKIALTIIMPIGQDWKKMLDQQANEFLKRIRLMSNNVKEVQRPLTYQKVYKLFGFIRNLLPQSSPYSTSSPDSIASNSPDKEDVVMSGDVKGKSKSEASTINPFEEAISKISLRSFKVLVVEDNPINTKIITTLLRRAGIDYIEAIDGEEGVEMFKRDLPALVLLDINMPKMNGFDAAIAMRAHPSPYEHHIAAVTALSSEEDRARGFEAGMDAWYTKPMRMGKLIENVKKIRDSHQQKGLILSQS